MLAHYYAPVPTRPALRPPRAASPAAAATATLFDAVRRSRRLPPRLKDVLLRACAAPRPFRSVARLSAAAGCDRRTLWRDWRQGVGQAPLRLEDVLHWMLLTRALALKTPHRAWCDVADELGVHPHTLGRFARLFTGLPLRCMESEGARAAAEWLDRRILPHLGDDASHLSLV